jgi:four helix bundle protein
VADFKELKVWSKSMDLAVSIYGLTSKFPEEERFGLTSQLRRAAVSIPSNIAEGSSRGSNKEFFHFLRIADGSSAEVETQLLIASRLGFVNDDPLSQHVVEIRKMLAGLIRSLLTAKDT